MPDNDVTLSPGGRHVPSQNRGGDGPPLVPDPIVPNRTQRPNLRAPSPLAPVTRDLPSSMSPPLSAEHPAEHPLEPMGDLAIALRVHGDPREIEAEWRAFERHADCLVFQTFDWLAKLQEHIGAPKGTVPAIVCGRGPQGELLFILPLAIERRGPLRCLTFFGSELCDYNAPLLAPEFGRRVDAARFRAIWRDVVALLNADARFHFDWIDLPKMPDAVGAQRNPFVDLDVAVHPSGAYVASLGSDWETYYTAKRSSATRKKERKQLKQLAEHGEIRFVDPSGRADIERTVDTLIAQKSRAFGRMGIEDLFNRAGYRAFYRDIATDPKLGTTIHVSRLDVGTTPAATNMGLRFRDSYYLVLSSYDDGEISRFGPGRAHLQELMRSAIAKGFRRFDFTVGDEPYKRDWSDIELKLYDYLAANTPRGRLAVAMVTAFLRTKRFIKQTPALWHAFSKARAFKASLKTSLRRR
jgi:CelD/BcsL family acetyltransferase involved in cellulose biosynthesis